LDEMKSEKSRAGKRNFKPGSKACSQFSQITSLSAGGPLIQKTASIQQSMNSGS